MVHRGDLAHQGIEDDAVPCDGKAVVAEVAVDDDKDVVVDVEVVGDVTVAAHGIGDGDKDIGSVVGEGVAIEGARQQVLDDGVVVGAGCGITDCQVQRHRAVAIGGVGECVDCLIARLCECLIVPDEAVADAGGSVARGAVPHRQVQCRGAVAVGSIGAVVCGMILDLKDIKK